MTSARSEPKKRSKPRSPAVPPPDAPSLAGSQRIRQTAEGNGCLSGFLIPPIAALCVSALLFIFVAGFTNAPAPASPAQTSLPAAAAVESSGGALSALFTPEIQFWAANIKRWSAENGVDVNLAATVMQIESCGNPDARSSSGAMGLFQVMPFHFLRYENGYDPNTNALRGLDYLRRSFEHARGDARLALAGYNGGIGVIDRVESTWPAETKRYVYWGAMYNDAVQNASHSTRLDEWKRATGNSLCIKASQRLGIKP